MEINALLKNELEKMKSSVSVIDEQFKMCSEKQSQLDLLLIDIYHEIELEKLSAPEMMKKYKELKACLTIRRRYKNMLEYINIVRGSIKTGNFDGAIKGIESLDKREGNKKYHHRIKAELREEILSEMD